MKVTRSTELLATLCTAILLTVSSVSFAALFDRDRASPFVLMFFEAFEEGADCAHLYELRNNAKHNGADNHQQKQMNLKLRSVGCSSDTAKRMMPEIPPRTGNFTVREYSIYREAISSPMSVPQAKALGNVAKKYKLSVAQVRKTIKKVQRNLFENNWMVGVPESEIRHALDWDGDKP